MRTARRIRQWAVRVFDDDELNAYDARCAAESGAWAETHRRAVDLQDGQGGASAMAPPGV